MNSKALVSEFVGTFALIFIGVGAIAANHITGGTLGLTGIALAHGLAIACMVTATAAVSGGHLNPAVTLGLLSIGKINAPSALKYILAQCAGAVAAAFALKVCVPEGMLSVVGWGTPAVNVTAGVTPIMALVTEIVLTFFLVYVVYGSAVDKSAPKMGGLFIGLTVALDITMGGAISGAAMNPARHLGPALVGGNMSNIWIYWLGPVLGAILAAQVAERTLKT